MDIFVKLSEKEIEWVDYNNDSINEILITQNDIFDILEAKNVDFYEYNKTEIENFTKGSNAILGLIRDAKKLKISSELSKILKDIRQKLRVLDTIPENLVDEYEKLKKTYFKMKRAENKTINIKPTSSHQWLDEFKHEKKKEKMESDGSKYHVLNVLFSYREERFLSRFQLSSFVKIPSFSNRLNKLNFQTQYEKDINDLFNILFTKNPSLTGENLTQEIRRLLLYDVMFDPYIMSNVVGMCMGQEAQISPSLNDDRLKIYLAYLFNCDVSKRFNLKKGATSKFQDIVDHVCEKILPSIDLQDVVDSDSEYLLDKVTNSFDDWEKDFNSHIYMEEEKLENKITKKDWFIYVESEMKDWLFNVMECEQIQNSQDIIEKSNYFHNSVKKYGDNYSRRMISDIIVGRIYELDLKKNKGKETIEIDSVGLHKSINAYKDEMRTSEDTTLLRYLLSFNSFINRISIIYYSSIKNITVDHKVKHVPLTIILGCIKLISLSVLLHFKYISIVSDFLELIDLNTEIEDYDTKLRLSFLVISVFLFNGTRDPHDFKNFDSTSYLKLSKLTSIIGEWGTRSLYGKDNILSEEFYNRSLDFLDEINFYKFEKVTIPIGIHIEIKDIVGTMKNINDLRIIDDLKKQSVKYNNKFIMLNKSDDFKRSAIAIQQMYYNLKWIENMLISCADNVEDYLEKNYSWIKANSTNVIREINTIHTNDPSKYVNLTFHELSNKVKNISADIKKLNTIAPNAPLDTISKSQFRSKNVSLKNAYESIIFDKKDIQGQRDLAGDIYEKEKENIAELVKRLDKNAGNINDTGDNVGVVKIVSENGNFINPIEVINPKNHNEDANDNVPKGYPDLSMEYEKFAKTYIHIRETINMCKEKFLDTKERWSDIKSTLSMMIGDGPKSERFGDFKSSIDRGINIVYVYLNNVHVLLYGNKKDNTHKFNFDKGNDTLKRFEPFLPYVYVDGTPKQTDTSLFGNARYKYLNGENKKN